MLSTSVAANSLIPDIESNVNETHEELVEKCDFGFVKKCADVAQLERILSLLKSGKEGKFEELEQFVEARILELGGGGDARQETKTCAQIPPEETQELIQDLKKWTCEIQEKSRRLKSASLVPVKPITVYSSGEIPLTCESVPMIQPELSQNQEAIPETQKSNEKTKTPRIRSDDYRRWDQLDVDRLLDDMDQAEQEHRQKLQQIQKQVQQQRLASEASLLDKRTRQSIQRMCQSITEQERSVLANEERLKGNECLKAQEYQQAVHFYSRSLEIQPHQPHILANRALVFLKQKKWLQCLDDCSHALELDPCYFKAWLRRGMVYHQQGRYDLAVRDFEKCLELDGEHAEARRFHEQSLRKWKEHPLDVNKAKESADESTSVTGSTRLMIQDVDEDDGDQDESEISSDEEESADHGPRIVEL